MEENVISTWIYRKDFYIAFSFQLNPVFFSVVGSSESSEAFLERKVFESFLTLK
jgi:hypothetical protein